MAICVFSVYVVAEKSGMFGRLSVVGAVDVAGVGSADLVCKSLRMEFKASLLGAAAGCSGAGGAGGTVVSGITGATGGMVGSAGTGVSLAGVLDGGSGVGGTGDGSGDAGGVGVGGIEGWGVGGCGGSVWAAFIASDVISAPKVGTGIVASVVAVDAAGFGVKPKAVANSGSVKPFKTAIWPSSFSILVTGVPAKLLETASISAKNSLFDSRFFSSYGRLCAFR